MCCTFCGSNAICVHRHRITQNGLTALRSSVLQLSIPPLPLIPVPTEPFAVSILPLPECDKVGTLQCVACSDGLLLLRYIFVSSMSFPGWLAHFLLFLLGGLPAAPARPRQGGGGAERGRLTSPVQRDRDWAHWPERAGKTELTSACLGAHCGQWERTTDGLARDLGNAGTAPHSRNTD